jgi:hypothetical protein
VTKVEKVVIMVKPEDLELDQILYNVALYLFQTEQEEAAELLLMCEFEDYEGIDIHYYEPRISDDLDSEYYVEGYLVNLSGPASVKKAIGSSGVKEEARGFFHAPHRHSEPTIRSIIEDSFEAVLRKSVVIDTHLQLVVDSEGDWREHLRRLAKGP